MPLWNDLEQAMARKLAPAGKPPRARGGAARLALEVEATFGRATLDDLIAAAVPDTEYAPGELHNELLDLPWADVFTTNYDTLLERASLSPRVSVAYDVVLSREDLPFATAPRIFKLHGSLPGQRPFVVTEEDYRRYPRTAAPFVGAVRQTMVENDVVLLGFSGEDPNFLAWIGWVRDELRESAPSVYLCGLLNLSTSQRKVIERRGVVPIDLAPLKFGSGGDAHARAYRWLLRSLANGRRPDGLSWPKPLIAVVPDPGEFEPIPPLPWGGREPQRPRENLRNDSDAPNLDLAELTQEWRRTREAYPGWLWTPASVRSTLRSNTEEWKDTIVQRASDLSPTDRLLLVGEYAWRLERAYVPINTSMEELIIQTLDARPWGELVGADEQFAYEAAALALHRATRYETPSAFEHVQQYVDVLGTPNANAALCRDRACRALGYLNQGEALRQVEAWPSDAGPGWELRRAGLLIEMGQVEEGRAVVESVLEQARRSKRARSSKPYVAASLEGAAANILWYLDIYHRREYDEQTARRRSKRIAQKCDPMDEFIDIASTFRDNPPPGIKPEVTTQINSMGHELKSYAMFERSIDQEAYLPAHAYFDWHDDTGLPLWIDGWNLLAGSATEWAADVWFSRACEGAMRSLDAKTIDQIFDRMRVAEMNQDEREQRARCALAVIESAKPFQELPEHERPRASSLVVAAVALLRRLMYGLAVSERIAGVRAMLQAMARDTVHGSLDMTMDKEVQLAASELLSHEAAHVVEDASCVSVDTVTRSGRDPFGALRLEEVEHFSESTAGEIDVWVGKARRGEDARRKVIQRLNKLHQRNLLTPEQQSAYGTALWAKLDDDGLPEASGLRRWALPAQPGRKASEVQSVLRGVLLRSLEGYASMIDASSYSYGFGTDQIDDIARTGEPLHPSEAYGRPGSVRIDWTREEAEQILVALERIVRGGLSALSRDTAKDRMRNSDIEEQLPLIADVLRRVVLQIGADESGELRRRVAHLMKALRQAGSTTQLLALELWIGNPNHQEARSTAEHAIRKGLASYDPEQSEHSVRTLCHWAYANHIGRVDVGPTDQLLDELADLVLARRPRHTVPALRWTRILLRHLNSEAAGVLSEKLADVLILILEETGLPTWRERAASRSEEDRLALLRRPDVAAEAARLVAALGNVRGLSGRAANVISQWRAQESESPYLEVRAALSDSNRSD
jgi:hypothetical protein